MITLSHSKSPFFMGFCFCLYGPQNLSFPVLLCDSRLSCPARILITCFQARRQCLVSVTMGMPHKPKIDGVERPTWCINPWQWRNTVTRSVTYILVAFLVCETIGKHFVQASTPYVVGDRFVPGAMWTNMLNGTINSTGLQDAYQQWASSVSIAVGDSIEFNYEEGAHTVHLLSNSADFAACNTASGVTVSTSAPPTIYLVQPTDPSTLYFICTLDSHCLDGQKVAIHIKGTGLTPVSPPVATPSGSAGNHLHHSLEMVPLLLAITSYLIFLGHLQ